MSVFVCACHKQYQYGCGAIHYSGAEISGSIYVGPRQNLEISVRALRDFPGKMENNYFINAHYCVSMNRQLHIQHLYREIKVDVKYVQDMSWHGAPKVVF